MQAQKAQEGIKIHKMAKQLDSKCKLCRRAGEKLFLKGERCATPKCAMVRKPYPPGMHGNTRGSSRGLSEFGKQLAEKQKLKKLYGVSEKQFRKHLAEASKQKGVLGEGLLTRLEMRFDNIIYRLGVASSRAQARQLVGHAMFQVNGKNLNIPSALLKAGDEISVKGQKMGSAYMKELQAIIKKKHETPSWLSFDPKAMKGKILSNPPKEDLGAGIDTHLVIEFYSR